MRPLVLACALGLAGCGSMFAKPRQAPVLGQAPGGPPIVHLTGEIDFTAEGKLRLTLDDPCQVELRRPSPYRAPVLVADDTRRDCTPLEREGVIVMARAPWGLQVRGTWVDGRHLEFRVPWAQPELDPLADDAYSLAAEPWAIGSLAWRPSPAEARTIIRLIGDATDTQPDLVAGGPAPALEVSGLSVAGDVLRAGADGVIALEITNRGPGVAYRVIATTRASIGALHGLRAGFGRIDPGQHKRRELHVRLPVSENAPDTMLVIVVDEGNGFTPRNASRRIAIAPVAEAPVLEARCAVVAHVGDRPELEAGEHVILRCDVANTGRVAAQVDLAVAIDGGAPVEAPMQVVAAGSHASFDVPLLLPRELRLDAPVELVATARDRRFDRTAVASVVGVVRKPRVCEPGSLTRAQYAAKITQLRAAVTAGDMTAAEFDRYDAELVGCLK